jgi:hypothetical protein
MSSARGSHIPPPLRELLPLTPTTAAASTLLALLWSFFLVVITTPSHGSAAKDNGDWLGDAAQYGPFYMPIAESREQMARPNATGRYPLPGGPDIPARFRQDDGSCSSVLSQQCVGAIEAETVWLYTSSFDLRMPCHCPDLEKISACGAEEAKILRSGGIWRG